MAHEKKKNLLFIIVLYITKVAPNLYDDTGMALLAKKDFVLSGPKGID
jgi:hypothetical protein